MRTLLLIICLILPGALLLAAGCTEEAIAIESTATTPAPTTTPAESVTPSASRFVSAGVLSLQEHIMTPPYWEAMIRVDNNGPVDVYHVVTRIQLIDAEDGTVRDWKVKDFDQITAGDHKIVTVKLYGEKDRQYRAEVQIISSQDDR